MQCRVSVDDIWIQVCDANAYKVPSNEAHGLLHSWVQFGNKFSYTLRKLASKVEDKCLRLYNIFFEFIDMVLIRLWYQTPILVVHKNLKNLRIFRII